MQRRKIARPKNEYESECWSQEANERGMLLRQVVNPENKDLFVYYPGSGGETIISRFIGAGTQIQVNNDYHYPPLNKNKKVPDGTRREYKVQWLKVFDYFGDALETRPPEIAGGINVYIDKCGVQFEHELRYKAFIYNLIREGGYVIDDGHQHFFVGLDPGLFGFSKVLDGRGGSGRKGEPFHLRVFRKFNGLYLPEQLFEADNLIPVIAKDKEYARNSAEKGLNSEVDKGMIETAREKLEAAAGGLENAVLAGKLRKFSEDFLDDKCLNFWALGAMNPEIFRK